MFALALLSQAANYLFLIHVETYNLLHIYLYFYLLYSWNSAWKEYVPTYLQSPHMKRLYGDKVRRDSGIETALKVRATYFRSFFCYSSSSNRRLRKTRYRAFLPQFPSCGRSSKARSTCSRRAPLVRPTASLRHASFHLFDWCGF
jgi:hypothetical protein